MKIDRLFLNIDYYNEQHKMCKSKNGKYVRWSEDLQKLADKDEVKQHYLNCPNCGDTEYMNNEHSNSNNFCGNCGQRLKENYNV